MFLEHTRLVTEKSGPRPAGKPDECFYCQAKIGEEHRTECVLRKKVVMLKIEVTIPVVVPADWDEDQVNFHRNDSTWCASSIVRDFVAYDKATDNRTPCLCHSFSAVCLGDATSEDLIGVDLVALTDDDD